VEAFGRALTEVDIQTGRFFQEAQGGTYREKLAADAVRDLLNAGAYGVGQSSWGPCLYGLVDGRTEGDVVRAAQKFLDEHGLEGKVVQAGPNNKGAEILVKE
jgi:beta-ribofuranosylaminobenzene 5'-phosphate synthase